MVGPNIVLARIDDRLIHGQVVVKWLRAKPCDEIVISDDEVSQDAFLQRVLALAVPKGVKMVVHAVDDTASYLLDAKSVGNKRIMLLMRRPEAAARLVSDGLPLPALNIGSQAPSEDSHRIYKTVSLTVDQLDILSTLAARGTRVYFQSVPEPEESPVAFETIRQRMAA